jgi:hypothetical protein
MISGGDESSDSAMDNLKPMDLARRFRSEAIDAGTIDNRTLWRISGAYSTAEYKIA